MKFTGLLNRLASPFVRAGLVTGLAASLAFFPLGCKEESGSEDRKSRIQEETEEKDFDITKYFSIIEKKSGEQLAAIEIEGDNISMFGRSGAWQTYPISREKYIHLKKEIHPEEKEEESDSEVKYFAIGKYAELGIIKKKADKLWLYSEYSKDFKISSSTNKEYSEFKATIEKLFCSEHISDIAYLEKKYATEHKYHFTTLSEALSPFLYKFEEVLICPASGKPPIKNIFLAIVDVDNPSEVKAFIEQHTDYLINPNAETDNPNDVLVYERIGNHKDGGHVVYVGKYDDPRPRAEWKNRKELEKIIRAIEGK